MSFDPYKDPATGVLRNCLDITDADALAAAESDYSAFRLAQIARDGLAGGFDLAHLQEFHARIFADVYPWAGELRTVGLAKGIPFCPPENIESFSREVFVRLARENLLCGRGRDGSSTG